MLRNISYFAFANTTVFLLKFLSIPVVARFTTPQDFGVIAFFVLISGFTSVVFGKSGLSASLTSKFDASVASWSTALYFNLLLGVFIYIVIYLTSKFLIAELALSVSQNIFLLFFLVIPFSFANDIFSSRLHLAGSYKLESFITIISEFFGMLSCLVLVFNGYAIEGLVMQHVVAASLKNIVLLLYCFKYFSIEFSNKVLWGNFYFSMSTASVETVNYLVFYLPQMIIGKFFGLSLLGAYSIFNRFTAIPSDIVQSAIYKVVIVEGAKSRNIGGQSGREMNSPEILFAWSLSIYNISVVPCLLFIAVFFQPIVLLVAGEQYRDFSYVMLALAMLRCSTIVVSGVNPLLKSIGKVNQLLVLYIFKILLIIFAILISLWFESFIVLLILLQLSHLICIPLFIYRISSVLGDQLDKVITELKFFTLVCSVAVFFGVLNHLLNPGFVGLLFELFCCFSIFILGQRFVIPDYRNCRSVSEYINGFVKRVRNE